MSCRLSTTVGRESTRRLRPRGFSLQLCLTALLAACLLCAPLHAAQQNRPSIASEVEGEKRPRTDSGRKRSGDTTRTPTRRRSGQPATHAVAAQPAQPLEVTFITGMAQAELFVRSPAGRLQRLGQAGADGRFVTRMPRGVYDITASRAGYQAVRQLVEVRPGSTLFSLNLAGQPSSSAAAASTSSADEIFKRFSDPKQTDSVTASDWQLAQSLTSAAFAQNPDDARIKAQSLFVQGQLAFLRGDYPSALAAFNNSARALPGSGLAFYGLGNAYLAINQPAEAMQAYQRAVQLSDGMAMAYKGLGDALARQGRSKDALAYYNRARTLGYDSVSLSLGEAQSLMRLKRWDEALKQLLEVSRREPSATLFIHIGDCYAELGQPMSAAPAYQKAIELNRKSALAHARYGEVMYNSREYAAASEAFERALALDPDGRDINRARLRKLANQAAQKVRSIK